MPSDSTKRFSKTIDNYIKFRPGYPKGLIRFFKEKLGGDSQSVIADIGSGTGLLTQLFLENGNRVFGVEPNLTMREAAEKILGKYSNFKSINGTAEQTQLANQSIDFLVAGQAFHWFDLQKSRNEFKRILNQEGQVLLIWNTRDDERSEFMKKYNQYLLTYSTDYQEIMHRRLGFLTFKEFFGKADFKKTIFENFQIFDLEGLKGRYLSCSYALAENNPLFAKALLALEELFDLYQINGTIKMWYQTEVYSGKLN